MAAVMNIDIDALRFHFGIALEDVFDLALDVVGLYPRLDHDAVDHSDHTGKFANGAFRRGALIMPVHLSRQCGWPAMRLSPPPSRIAPSQGSQMKKDGFALRAEHILFLCVGILVGGTIYGYSGDVDLLSAIGAGLGAGALTYIGARLKLGWLRD